MGLLDFFKKETRPGAEKAVREINDYADGWVPIGGSSATAAWQIILPGTNRDWTEEAGDLYLNGVVSSCLRWIMENIQEPRIVVATGDKDTMTTTENHPVVDLLRYPNPSYEGTTLLMATSMSDVLDGNAFWYVQRDKQGVPIEFYWLPEHFVDPYNKTGTPIVDGYKIRVKGNKEKIESKDNIIHFRFGIDQEKKLRGFPRLRGVLREICLDNSASTYEVCITENMGIPGVVISPKDSDGTFTPSQLEVLKNLFKTKTTGDRRGEPIGSTIPVNMQQMGFTPEQLSLDTMHDRPEARICAAIGIPAMVIGLMVGNEQRTYDNYGEAKKAAYKDCLLPMGYRWMSTLTRFFQKEGMLSPKERLVLYTGHIAALQEDESERHKRVRETFMAGILTRNESRQMLGLAALPDERGDELHDPARPFPTKEEPEGGPKKQLLEAHLKEMLRG